MEKLKALMDGFDIAAILPKMEELVGHAQPVLRFAVLAGPVCLLVLGILYLLVPTREANRYFGYRCFFGMGSSNAWKMTQKIVGIAWTALGLMLLCVMAALSGRFSSDALEQSAMLAVRCILWEIGLVALSCIGVDVAMGILFDRNGKRRRKKK